MPERLAPLCHWEATIETPETLWSDLVLWCWRGFRGTAGSLIRYPWCLETPVFVRLMVSSVWVLYIPIQFQPDNIHCIWHGNADIPRVYSINFINQMYTLYMHEYMNIFTIYIPKDFSFDVGTGIYSVFFLINVSSIVYSLFYIYKY